MGLWQRLKRSVGVWKQPSPSDDSAWTILSGGNAGGVTMSGMIVDKDTALTLSGVYRAIDLTATAIAGLPVGVLRKTDGEGAQPAPNSPAHKLIRGKPNEFQTAFEFKRLQMIHLLIWGNSYALIQRDNAGVPIGLIALDPKLIRARLAKNYVKEYVIKGGEYVLAADAILHITGLGSDGINGFSVIELAAESLGKSLATDRYGAAFFGNDGRPGIALRHPGVLSEAAHKNLRESFLAVTQGVAHAQSVAILEEGIDIKTISLPPEHAQFIETARWNMTDVARWFGVPLHKLSELSNAHFNSLEQANTAWVTDSLVGWATNFEQRYNADLLSDAERMSGHYTKHRMDGLLRGDLAARAGFYGTMRQWGAMSANDIRALEDWNPVEGGDVYLSPVNMVASSAIVQVAPAPVLAPRSLVPALEMRVSKARFSLRRSFAPMFEDVARAVIARERADIMRMAKKIFGGRSKVDMEKFIIEFYAKHDEFVAKKLRPTARTFADVIARAATDEVDGAPEYDATELEDYVNELVANVSGAWTKSSRGQMLEVLAAAEAGAEMDELLARFDGWQDTRPAKFGARETATMAGAVARWAFKSGGVSKLRWITVGKNCPFCNNLDGKIVGIQENFLSAGTVLDGGGQRQPLAIRSNITHPPIHRGCDCQIVPA